MEQKLTVAVATDKDYPDMVTERQYAQIILKAGQCQVCPNLANGASYGKHAFPLLYSVV